MGIKISVTDTGFYLEPGYPESVKKLLQYYHRETKTGSYGGPVTVGYTNELYVESEDGLNVPLNGLLPAVLEHLKAWKPEVVDTRLPMPKPDIAAALVGLRDYQVPAVTDMLSHRDGIYSCPTGWGKGRLLAAPCRAFSQESMRLRGTPLQVVAAPDKDIVAKNYEELKQLLPGRKVGIVMSGITPVFTDDVMVCTLDSLARLNPEEIGVLVVDEVHTAGSKSRSWDIAMCNRAARWGVSATPFGRCDGADKLTIGLFGPARYTSSYADGVASGALVPMEVWWLRAGLPNCGLPDFLEYQMRTAKERHGIVRNTWVNNAIATVLRQSPADMQILGITKTIEHLDHILAACHRQNFDNLCYVHGSTTASSMKETKYVLPISKAVRQEVYQGMSDRKILRCLSTYVYKQGVNFPGLDLIIHAGGGGSKIVTEQIPGRGSRKTEGKSKAYTLDFWHDWDTGDPDYPSKSPGALHRDDLARRRIYKKLGFKQTFVDSPEELPWMQKGFSLV
jgi:superfamily II DNA or RNA helicase